MIQIILFSFYLLNSLTHNVYCQQNYSGLERQSCDVSNENYLYTCNGEDRVCQAFFIFKSRPPYDSVETISKLMFSPPKELSRINAVSESEVFPMNKEVIVPVNCSCAGQYYQANTTVIVGVGDTYLRVANDIYQGLTPCNSLRRINQYGELDLKPGMELKVPLSCACPTRNQTVNDIKYLLTYSVNPDDNIPDIGDRFNVSSSCILEANGLSEQNPTIFNYVPILIPLPTEPSSSVTISQDRNEDQSSSFPPVFGSNPRKKESKDKIYKIFAITAGCSLLIFGVLLLSAVVIYKKRSNGLALPRQTTRRRLSPEDLRVEIASFEKGLHVFEMEELRKATGRFSAENRIKGSIYSGVFGKDDTCTTLAIKKTKGDASREVSILKKLNHFNLIKLEGVCNYHDRFYLVFEFMANGSLREWLCKNDNDENSSWNRRIQIALDIAHGLNYLHSFTKPGYVHKNIKSSNILLNRNMRAKIANFGLAGPATDHETTSRSCKTTTTTHVVGTRGYVAPEYLATGIATPKIDVFAFGVVILELMTGKKAASKQNGTQVLLSKAIVEIMDEDNINNNPEADLDLFIDPNLKEDDRYLEFGFRLAKLSVACLNPKPESRPSMAEVVSILTKIQADLHLQTT